MEPAESPGLGHRSPTPACASLSGPQRAGTQPTGPIPQEAVQEEEPVTQGIPAARLLSQPRLHTSRLNGRRAPLS